MLTLASDYVATLARGIEIGVAHGLDVAGVLTLPAGGEEVEAGFRSTHAVVDISDRLPITRGRLDALCRRHAGRTAPQVIHDRIVLEAQRGLIYTGLTVAEIAYELGFVDPAYFTRFFAREVGETPGEFRRRHREPQGGHAA